MASLRKIVSVIVVVFGVAAILAVIFAGARVEWRPHFFDLLRDAWTHFREAEGSSTIGVVTNWVSPIFILGVVALFIWRGEGWSAVREHWKAELAQGLRIAVYSALLLYGPVFLWQLINRVYIDHQTLTASNKKLREAVNTHLATPADDPTKPHLLGQIHSLTIGSSPLPPHLAKANVLILWVAIKNMGEDTIVEDYQLTIDTVSKRHLVTHGVGVPKKILLPDSGQSIPDADKGWLVQKTINAPIRKGSQASGLLMFAVTEQATHKELIAKGTILTLSFEDITGRLYSVSYTLTGESIKGSLDYVPGTPYFAPKK